MAGFTGISYPFRISSRGGIASSTTSAFDAKHIEEAIRQIVGTMYGERIMEDFGTKTAPSLFDMAIDVSPVVAVLRMRIEQALAEYESRVEVEDIAITPEEDDEKNSFFAVTISIYVKQYQLRHTIEGIKLGGVA